MKYLLHIILLVLFSPLLKASSEQVIIGSILEEILKRSSFENLSPKTSLNDGRRGKMIIEQIKKKNREQLAIKQGISPEDIKSGKDIVKKKKDQNKQLLKEMKDKDIISKELRNIFIKKYQNYKVENAKKLQQLKVQKTIYNQKQAKYKGTTFSIPLILPVDKKNLKKKSNINLKSNALVIKGAFSLEVKDQKFRPTCSSFAAVRGLEVLAAQRGLKMDLSEQYFYYLSKKKCQSSPCSHPGSWAGYGLESLTNTSLPDEKDCPYNIYNKPRNQTQLPLQKSCFQEGKVRNAKFTYIKNTNDILSALKNNFPVIVGAKLTPNFYKNDGLILNQEKNIGAANNSHANGHAFLLIGAIKLPKQLNEGKYCFILANSWGSGYGIDGHSCISESWLIENRNINPFIRLESFDV